MTFFADFFDSFFLVIAILVAVLGFSDFLIGRKNQQAIKEKLGNYWLYLETNSNSQIMNDLTHTAFRLFKLKVGKSSRFLGTLILSAKILSVFFLVRVAIFIIGSPHAVRIEKFCFPECSAIEYSVDVATFSKISVIIFPVATASMFVALSVFLFSMWLTSKVSNIYLVLLALLLTAVICAGAGLTSYFLFFRLLENISEYYNGWNSIFFFIADTKSEWVLQTLAREILYLFVSPAVLTFCLFAILVFAKLTVRYIKPAVSLLVLRFHESHAGILTNFALAIGVIAKLAQQTLKTLL